MDSLGIESSLEKIVAVKELCKKMFVQSLNLWETHVKIQFASFRLKAGSMMAL
jgi:hypothetical protein